MSKKHYILIAKHLNHANQILIDKDTKPGFEIAVFALIDALAKDNPWFDKERFRKACGV